jgi:myosin heavy subunit
MATRFDMAAGAKSRLWPFAVGVLFLALIAQSALLYPRLRVKDAEIASLQESIQASAQREAEGEASRRQAAQSQAEELARLRKDNQELHRLRNEVRQLRDATQQAARSVQPAAAAPSPAATELVGQLQRQLQQLQAENAQLRAAQEVTLNVQSQVNACVNQLRQIDGAKQQWALENRQPAEAVPEPGDLEPYLPDPAWWSCPAGGVYTLNAVGLPPTCSVPGHALP